MIIYINNFGIAYKEYELYSLCYPLAKLAKIQSEISIGFWGYVEGGLLGCQWDGKYCPCIDIFVDEKNKYPYESINKATQQGVMIKSQIDLMRFTIAHEFYHVNRGHPRNFKKENGDTDYYMMELCCDNFASLATGIKN